MKAYETIELALERMFLTLRNIAHTEAYFPGNRNAALLRHYVSWGGCW